MTVRFKKTVDGLKRVVQLHIQTPCNKISKDVFLGVVQTQIGCREGLFDMALQRGSAQNTDLHAFGALGRRRSARKDCS
jgi:hypothetical protein